MFNTKLSIKTTKAQKCVFHCICFIPINELDWLISAVISSF